MWKVLVILLIWGIHARFMKKMVDSSQLILTLLLDVFQPMLESFQLIRTEPFVKDRAVIVSGAMNWTL